MFSVASNDDDDTFIPVLNNNLAALFNTNPQIISEKVNLSYTAPKQPKKLTENNTATATVLCAKVAQVYKLINSKYVLQGKFGFAISGNASTQIYEFIIYKDRKNIRHRTRLHAELKFTLLPNNFASFFDENKDNWSVYFDNAKDLEDITHQLETIGIDVIAIAKEPVQDIKKAQEQNDDEKPSEVNTVSVESTKENILSRMAKMGQPVLKTKPTLKPKPSENSDSETDSSENVKQKPKILARKNPTIVTNYQNVPIYQPPQYHQHQPPMQVQMIPQLQSPFLNDPMQLFISEVRTHNSEIRMHLMKLTNEVEKLQQNSLSNSTEIGSSTAINSNCNNNSIDFSDKLNTIIQKLEENSSKDALLLNKIDALENRVRNFETNDNNSTLQEIKELLIKQNQDINDLKAAKHNEDISSCKDNIKKIMNTMYKEINHTFDENQVYREEIKSTLADKIVETTHKIIENLDNSPETKTESQLDGSKLE